VKGGGVVHVVLDINSGSLFNEIFGDRGGPTIAGQVKRGLQEEVAGVHVGLTLLHERLSRVKVPEGGSEMQGGLAVLILKVRIGPTAEKQLDDVNRLRGGGRAGLVQEGVALAILKVGIEPRVKDLEGVGIISI